MLLLLFSCATTVITIYIFASLATPIGLLATPNTIRQHEKPTPVVGGLAIFTILIISIPTIEAWTTLSLDRHYNQSLFTILYSASILIMVGVLDDRYGLPSSVRVLAQAITAFLMVKHGGVYLADLGYLLSNDILSLGSWSYIVTIVATVGVINAINMSDGIDGLAASTVLLIIIALLLLGAELSFLLIVIIGNLLAFLFFNTRLFRSQAYIFLGDAGSTILGFIVAWLLIFHSQGIDRIYPPVTALWLIAIPLIDTLSLLIIRPILGKSPFIGDRLHIHHRLMNMGFSVNKTLLLIIGMQAAFIAAGIAMIKVGMAEPTQLILFSVVFMSYFSWSLKKSIEKPSIQT